VRGFPRLGSVCGAICEPKSVEAFRPLRGYLSELLIEVNLMSVRAAAVDHSDNRQSYAGCNELVFDACGATFIGHEFSKPAGTSLSIDSAIYAGLNLIARITIISKCR
jgi:hypothetical protein